MASTPNDPHTPISNLTRESRASEEDVAEPETGTEAGIADPDGEVEAGGAARARGFGAESAPAAMEAPDTSHLQDVGTASFEDPSLFMETVHGVDNRVRIEDTTRYPFRAIASLLITARDGTQYVGTGWFISPRTLATAGHCVFIKNSGRPNRDGWVRSIQVMPGRNGAALPFGSVTSQQFFSVKGWADSGDESFDYGAIIVPTELGRRVGWFGYGVFPDSALQGPVLNVTGYPGDKPGTLWHDAKTAASLSSTKVHYDIDTVGGQSGAPCYMIRDGNRYGVAIHAYGGAVTNSGTRISPPVMKNLSAWRR